MRQYFNPGKPRFLTEAQVDRIWERFFDTIDPLLMDDTINQECYNQFCRELSEWEGLCRTVKVA